MPGELIYVNYYACGMLRHYRRIGMTALKEADIVCMYHPVRQKTEKDQLLENIEGNVWLLFAHPYGIGTGDNEEHHAVNTLLRRKAVLLDQYKAVGSTCYYFDVPGTATQ
jgi:hypothetical protein